MDKQVLVAVVGGDETKPLVVAEPLYCASRHVGTPPRCSCCDAEDAVELLPPSTCTAFAGLMRRPDETTVAGPRPPVLSRCCSLHNRAGSLPRLRAHATGPPAGLIVRAWTPPPRRIPAPARQSRPQR